MAKLIILSGPSCVGKGPLTAALKKFHPHLARGLEKLIVYNSRPPRPGEANGVDYFFRRREVIEDLGKNPQYLVENIRGDLQAIDLEQFQEDLKRTNLFFEGNPILVEAVKKNVFMKKVEIFSVFLSPLSQDEISFLKAQNHQIDLQAFVTDVMRRKLLRRTQRHKTILSLKDLDEIERRASSALGEMAYACRFDYVIPNHDGEDSDHWDAFYYPLGDARQTLECFAALLEGRPHPFAEKWDSELLRPYHHEQKD